MRENRLHKNPKKGNKSDCGPHRRDVTHISSKVSCFLLKSLGYRSDRSFSHTNPYISNVTQQCRCSPDVHISSLGYLCSDEFDESLVDFRANRSQISTSRPVSLRE